MKTLFLTSILFLSTTLITTAENVSDMVVGDCEAYCAGYADGQESQSPAAWSTEQWMEVYNNCVDNSDYCQQ